MFGCLKHPVLIEPNDQTSAIFLIYTQTKDAVSQDCCQDVRDVSSQSL